MLIYKFLPSIFAAVIGIIGILIGSKAFKIKANAFFSILCLLISFWAASNTVASFSIDSNEAFFWLKVGFSFFCFVPVLFYEIIDVFLNEKLYKKRDLVLYAVSLFFLVLIWTNHFFASVTRHLWGYSPEVTWAILLFTAFYLFQWIRGKKLLRDFLCLNRELERKYFAVKKISFFYYFLLLWLVDVLVYLGFPGYPIGFFVWTIWITTMTYYIIKYRLLNFEYFIKKSITFTAIFCFIILPMFFCINFVMDVFLGFLPVGLKYISATLLWTIIFLISEDIKSFFVGIADEIVSIGEYNSIEVMKRVTEKFHELNDLQSLIIEFDELMGNVFGVDLPAIFIHDNIGSRYILLNKDVLSDGFGDQKINPNIFVPDTHPLIYRLMTASENLVIYDELLPDGTINDLEVPEIIEIMDILDSRLMISCVSGSEVKGAISLPAKPGNEPYSEKDRDLLQNIVVQIVLVIARILEIEEKAAIKAEKDISEKYSKELEEKNTQLNDKISELHEAQEVIIKQEKWSSLGKMAGEVAHDMRNPLSAMNRFLAISAEKEYFEQNKEFVQKIYEFLSGKSVEDVEIIKDMALSVYKNDTEIRDIFDNVQVVNGRLRKIANDFLDYSKQSQDIPEESICLLSMLQDLRPLIEKKVQPVDIDLTFVFESESKTMIFDYQFEKIVNNLIDNAIKAVSDDSIAKKEMIIKLSDVHGDNLDYVVLAVADSGVGIPQSDINKIFEPFYSKRKNLDGTGLGLAIVWKIVDFMGGHITVSSEVGIGTVFRIYFPIYLD